MVVEVPISLSGLVTPLVRLGVRVMPDGIRKRWPFISGVGLWANARVLRQHFNATDAKHDRHIHLIAIEGAIAILERLDIPHLEKKVGPRAWRAFLAHIVAAAEDANIKRARAAISNEEWGFMWARPNFSASLTTQTSTNFPSWPSVPDDPGNGQRVARLIMIASTEREVDELYGNFKGASPKTSESVAFAAYYLKMDRLRNEGDRDDDWWWDFYEDVGKRDDSDEVIAAFDWLEKEFPDEG